DRGDRVGDAWHQAERHDAVELSAAGRSPGGEQVDGAQYLAGASSAAASGQDVQAVAGCQVSGEIDRCGGPVSESAAAGAGAVRGREDADSGARSHAARPADEKGPLWNHDPRLQAQRDHDLVCRLGSLARACGWTMLRTASTPGVLALSAPSGPRVPRRDQLASGCWTITVRTSTPPSGLGCSATRALSATMCPPVRVG